MSPNLCNPNQTTSLQRFPVWRTDNSDSKGRWFESSRAYGWLSPETMTIDYGTHGMPDIGANQMYYSATESGPIDTMPDIPGLAVWHDGHIGVYIGGGQVIEAMGTKYGVVKTELAGRGWTHWLRIPYINYN